MIISILEVLQRSQTGERVTEHDFDLSIFRETEKLKKELDIRYDPQSPIASEDRLADELFKAGMKFFIDIGVYCINTRRVIKFTEKEVREALRDAPSQITFGQGRDSVVVSSLKIEGSRKPIVGAGIQTIPYSDEETMFKMCKLCAQDRCIDGIWGGVLKKINGCEAVANTPSEVYSYRRTAEILRKAVTAAGRPGMFILQNAATSVATIGMYGGGTGLRLTDPVLPTGISEMKICYDDLNRAVYATTLGIPRIAAQVSVIGAFSGSVEGAAIVCVAGALQALLVHAAELVFPAVIHYRVKSGATREILWAMSLALQALNRNSSLILCADGGAHPAAGPGTKQYLYEAAAGFITSTVCGAHPTGGTRKYIVGEKANFGSPLESRWMGEISKGSSGLTRQKANEIVRFLLEKYEANLENAPEGFVFEELYDLEKLEPRSTYLDLYKEAKEEVAGKGVNFGS